MKHSIYFLVVLVLVVSCKELEARRPKDHSTSNFYKEVIAQNKKLNALEKKRIEHHLEKDTLRSYETSTNGFWYTYVKKDTISVQTPKKGDVVTISYNVLDLVGNTIYDQKTRDYKVDEESMIAGLHDGIKLMKKGETITFVIPSYRGYGVTGDGAKIKMNQTIKSTLTLIDIKQPSDEVK